MEQVTYSIIGVKETDVQIDPYDRRDNPISIDNTSASRWRCRSKVGSYKSHVVCGSEVKKPCNTINIIGGGN